MRHYPRAKTCRHLEGDVLVDSSTELLVIDSGEDEEDLLILCPLCAKLAREKVLSDLFKEAATTAVKSAMSSFRVRSR